MGGLGIWLVKCGQCGSKNLRRFEARTSSRRSGTPETEELDDLQGLRNFELHFWQFRKPIGNIGPKIRELKWTTSDHRSAVFTLYQQEREVPNLKAPSTPWELSVRIIFACGSRESWASHFVREQCLCTYVNGKLTIAQLKIYGTSSCAFNSNPFKSHQYQSTIQTRPHFAIVAHSFLHIIAKYCKYTCHTASQIKKSLDNLLIILHNLQLFSIISILFPNFLQSCAFRMRHLSRLYFIKYICVSCVFICLISVRLHEPQNTSSSPWATSVTRFNCFSMVRPKSSASLAKFAKCAHNEGQQNKRTKKSKRPGRFI